MTVNETNMIDEDSDAAYEDSIAAFISEEERKISALATHLLLAEDDIEASMYDNDVFSTVEGEEYLVVDDDDADALAEDMIRNSLYAFHAEYICDRTDLPAGAVAMIRVAQEKCEESNDIIAALITDMDKFVDDVICEDGRGTLLSSYDGEEIELPCEYFAYKQ